MSILAGIESRAADTLRCFFDACLRERNPDRAAACLCVDALWIGMGPSRDSGQGRDALGALLHEHFRAAPGLGNFELHDLRSLVCGETCVCVDGALRLTGKGPYERSFTPELHFSAVCREIDGLCLISCIHTSMPAGREGADSFFPSALGETTTSGMSSQSKERALELLKDSLPGGLIGGFVEPGFPLYFINDNLIRHLGYASYENFVEDIQGMVENGIHPDDRAHVNRVVEESLAVSDHYEVVYRMLTQKGGCIWVLDRGRVTEDCGRKVIVSIIIDITRQRELQESLERGMASLERKNAELGAFYQVMASGIAKVLDDPGYTLLYANDQFFHNLGYTREEVSSLFHNETLRMIHPDDAERTDKEIRRVKEQGRFSIKCRFTQKNGDIVRMRLEGCQTSESHDGYNVIYSFCTNIEEQERRDAAYQRQQHFMSLISSSIAGGTFITRATAGRPLAYASDNLLSLLGYAREDFEKACGGKLTGIVHPDDRERLLTAFQGAQEEYYEEEYRIRKADGNMIWALEKGRLATDEDDEQIYSCVLLDITDRRLLHEELVRRTRMDPLTGLYNQEYAREYIQGYLDIHPHDSTSALLLFDLDNFKCVNDHYGHLEGDAALTRFAALLKEQFHSRDFLARTGGDEFIAFVQDIPSEQAARELADKAIQRFTEQLGKEYPDCDIALSVGMAFSAGQADYNLLFRAADEAMYLMKNKGRDGGGYLINRAEREFERHLLFKQGMGIVLRIDLESGQYNLRYGAYALGPQTPSSGHYERLLDDAPLKHVLPGDKKILRAQLALEQLRAACARGEEMLSCQYRVRGSSNELLWVESRFYFLCNENSRLAYNVTSDITEKKKLRERQRVAELYAMTLQNSSDEVYELDMQRGRYQSIRDAGGGFLDIPPRGPVEDLPRTLRDKLIHPDERERFDSFHQATRENRNSKSSRDEFRCLWRDGVYHWVSISVLPTKGTDHLYFVCIMDIEDRKKVKIFSSENEQLRQHMLNEERYRIIVEQSGSIVLDFDLEKGTRHAPGLHKLLACDPRPHENPLDILRSLQMHPDDQPLLDAFHKALRDESEAVATLRFKRTDGAFIWCRVAVTVQRDAVGKALRIVGALRDVDKDARALRQLRYQAEHDPVTGYSNMAKFKLDATRLLAARSGREYVLWQGDFRNFKYINDMYGYDVGNRLLKYCADLLAATLTPEETFARVSADNFVLLRAYEDISSIEKRFQALAESLQHFEELACKRFRVELVAGCYLVKADDTLSVDDMLDRAIMAQKSVKALGGSRYTFYSEDMRKKLFHEKELEAHMEKALRSGEFHAWLQPQIGINNGYRLIGAEVLARWMRPGQGMVSPAEFIPLFERNGFIIELDAFIFEQACAYYASRHARGLPPLRLAVNVSRLSLGQKDFLTRYTDLRKRYAVPSGILELECTESLAMEDFPLLRQVMGQLPGQGFRRAMDDFGTGYSSLNLLKSIDLDVLKLDMEFFRNTGNAPRERAVIESVVRMARALNMDTVAEGIELPEQVDFLRTIGCDAIQGYIFSPPLSQEDFEKRENNFALPWQNKMGK